MKYRSFILLFLSTILFCGCKKEIDTIGLSFQDDDLLNAQFMELPITAYSVLEDSLYTKNLLNNVVGAVNDPVFGRTEAGFCTQFDLAGSNTSLIGSEDVVALDSVVLSLQYSGFFGDTLSPMLFEVYELSEQLDKDNYYSNDDHPSHFGTNLLYSNASFYPRPTTPVTLDTIRYAAHARLRLSNDFGNRLLYMNSSDLANTAAFQSAFYGLVVKATTATRGVGSLSYISLTSAMSGITIYYTANDSEHKKYTFPISTNCVRYNFFTHDYSTASTDFRRQVIQHDTTLGQQMLYVQPTGGVKTHISMPALMDTLYGKRYVINRAELVIANVSTDASYFFQPYNLGLQLVTSAGTNTYLPDDASFTSSNYFGGVYDENTKEYRFRITNYIQQLQRNGINDKGINIVISGAGIRGNRLVLRGTDPSFADRLRLEVYYTAY